jgi:hypothetical protein
MRVLRRCLEGIGGLASRAINFFFYGGEIDLTISQRAHHEAHRADTDRRTRDRWRARRDQIDLVFFLLGELSHCERAWRRRVNRAREILRMDVEIGGQP